jgi:hypothetical protein
VTNVSVFAVAANHVTTDVSPQTMPGPMYSDTSAEAVVVDADQDVA